MTSCMMTSSVMSLMTSSLTSLMMSSTRLNKYRTQGIQKKKQEIKTKNHFCKQLQVVHQNRMAANSRNITSVNKQYFVRKIWDTIHYITVLYRNDTIHYTYCIVPTLKETQKQTTNNTAKVNFPLGHSNRDYEN